MDCVTNAIKNTLVPDQNSVLSVCYSLSGSGDKPLDLMSADCTQGCATAGSCPGQV